MISQLNDNPLGKVLSGISAGLLIVLLLLAAVWLLPPSAPQAAEGTEGQAVDSEVPELQEARPIEEYAIIVDRPVFNENRQPVIGGEVLDGEDDPLAQQEDVEAPDVELAGVVITPDVRIATLRLKGETESLVALEGQPLRGDFGSWKLSSIEPRSALLESAEGKRVKLVLQIHDAIIDAPPPGQEAPEDGADSASSGPGDVKPMTRAEEIRQRIAQRREELRRAAEEGGPPPETPQISYKDAIQSMITTRKEDPENEQENNDSEQ
ncbi:MAG: hypothetical protein HKO85_05760 [Xanthomonadales bacterium]|nr:hypothetical protein [Gammaproteobacteria bacterium]MBT8055962.1 hypothetical protein [Gammaproteobacteria bacterium]NNL04773.1 hypothetical protein [Xanthomonadales bacterium]